MLIHKDKIQSKVKISFSSSLSFFPSAERLLLFHFCGTACNTQHIQTKKQLLKPMFSRELVT